MVYKPCSHRNVRVIDLESVVVNGRRYAIKTDPKRIESERDDSLVRVDSSTAAEPCMWNMQRQTKFLWLRQPMAMCDQIDHWRVCWIGGWDKCRVFFVVMVESFGASEPR